MALVWDESFIQSGDQLCPPGKLFDADGNQLKAAVRADTETGEVVSIARHNDGRFVVKDNCLVRETSHHKPPLRFEPRKG